MVHTVFYMYDLFFVCYTEGVKGRDNPVADFIVQENTVYFNDTGRESSLSSSITVTIVDDLFSESQESFICIILKPFDSTGGIAVENPDTITISIVDNDCKLTCTQYHTFTT